MIGYVTADEAPGAGKRSVPAPPRGEVPEPPKMNTAATIPTAQAV
ncbi:hypothetical protein ACFCWY_33895 [Streptomyces sp. NPDC056362]